MTIDFLLRCPADAVSCQTQHLADRCHSLASLHLPQAALSALPLTAKMGNANTIRNLTKFGEVFLLLKGIAESGSTTSVWGLVRNDISLEAFDSAAWVENVSIK